jgi:threonine dehydrogenase-like Zn-dependent dehydrogenase
MKGIMFDFNMKKVIARKLHLGNPNIMITYKEDWPNPSIVYPNQVKVKTIYGGICT